MKKIFKLSNIYIINAILISFASLFCLFKNEMFHFWILTFCSVMLHAVQTIMDKIDSNTTSKPKTIWYSNEKDI